MRNYYTDPDSFDREKMHTENLAHDSYQKEIYTAQSALFWKKTMQAVLALVPIFIIPALGAVWFIKTQSVEGVYRIIPVFVALLCSWGMVFLFLKKVRISNK